ncbi:MAG: hypothetical protein ACR2L8_16940 [Solirubrobacteraceae bacterium]
MIRSGRGWTHRQVLVDAALVLWMAAWLWMGLTVGREVRGIGELSGTVSRLGQAVMEVGGLMSDLPLIGDQVDAPAEAVNEAGREAVASAREARGSANRVGVLLGISIALIPSSPVLLLYLPRRLAVARERRALTRALAGGRTPELDELLAERAVIHLPYHRLRRVSADPRGDLRDGRHAALADAELEWFGVRLAARSRRVPR